MGDDKMSGSVGGVPWPNVRAEILESVRRMYPQAEDDIDALALGVSNLRHLSRERNELMGLNALQAGRLAELRSLVDSLRCQVESLRRQVDEGKPTG